jgi:hypothetical protein
VYALVAMTHLLFEKTAAAHQQIAASHISSTVSRKRFITIIQHILDRHSFHCLNFSVQTRALSIFFRC